MCEMYRDLVEKLGDPERIARDVDESVIRWHAARLPKPPKHSATDRSGALAWTTEEVDALQRAAREEAASYVRLVD